MAIACNCGWPCDSLMFTAFTSLVVDVFMSTSKELVMAGMVGHASLQRRLTGLCLREEENQETL